MIKIKIQTLFNLFGYKIERQNNFYSKILFFKFIE